MAAVNAAHYGELFADPKLVEQAWEYFLEQTKETTWESRIPADVDPPVHLNVDKMKRFRPELVAVADAPAGDVPGSSGSSVDFVAGGVTTA